MRQLITVGIQAAAHPAQRNHAGAGQRGNVHDRCRLEAGRIGERIAQHQTSFRIGIENFDGLSTHAGNHITRLHGAAIGHVFARRDQTHHVQCGLQLGQGLEHPQHAGRPAHIKLHLVHFARRLDGDTARVKGNAFAH